MDEVLRIKEIEGFDPNQAYIIKVMLNEFVPTDVALAVFEGLELKINTILPNAIVIPVDGFSPISKY